MSRIYGLVMQALQSRVGGRLDAPDAAGSVHAKLAVLNAKTTMPVCVASANQKLYSATSHSANNTTTFFKSFFQYFNGTVRITATCREGIAANDGYLVYRINKGTAIRLFQIAGTTDVVYTADIPLYEGLVELGIESIGAHSVYAKEWKVSYDIVDYSTITPAFI